VYDPGSQIVVTCGGCEAVLDILLATIDPGDEVVLTDPIYAGLVNRVRLAGGVPVFAPLVVPTPVALPGTPLQAEPAVIEPTPVSMAPQAARQVASLR
jgi:aspartate/methionine/tyrosine aminotransferase